MIDEIFDPDVSVVKPAVIYSNRFYHLYDDTTALDGDGFPPSGWTGSKARIVQKYGPSQRAITNLWAIHSGAVATHSVDTSGTNGETFAAIKFSTLLVMYSATPVVRAAGPTASGGYFLQPPRSVDPKLAARQRKLLARAGGGVSVTQAAQQLNLSETEVDELRAAGRLLAVLDPDSQDWSYPACQFAGPRIVPGLAKVLGDFHVRSAWTRLYVLVSEDSALSGRTPIEALKDGDLDLVREIVSDYGQQGGA